MARHDSPHPGHVHDFDAARAQTLSSVVSVASEESLRNLLSSAGYIDMQRFFAAYFYGGWIARFVS
ncbi:MAG: hypothetical protein FJ147_03805 [Deltaproteobacteria bacterium]|nr:hypothetical protein [Deltaproteobacteria bacterium]